MMCRRNNGQPITCKSSTVIVIYDHTHLSTSPPHPHTSRYASVCRTFIKSKRVQVTILFPSRLLQVQIVFHLRKALGVITGEIEQKRIKRWRVETVFEHVERIVVLNNNPVEKVLFGIIADHFDDVVQHKELFD